MNEDAALLACYAREKSQGAFTELVRRRIDLVYAVALRKVGGDTHLAEDVTQRVFADVAKKAAALSEHHSFTGWLFRSAHYTATQMVRAERRRRLREEKAETMKELLRGEEAERAIDWDRLRPLIDDFINELGERDRAAIVGRFFEGLPHAEIGRRLRLSEAGAQSRVERAVEKLRAALARRGVTSTSGALGLVLANQAGATAPLGLSASVASAALAGAGGATAASGVMIFMSATKAAFGGSLSLSMAGALLLLSAGVAVYETRAERAVESEWIAARVLLAYNNATLTRIESATRATQGRLDAAKSRAGELRAAMAKPVAGGDSIGAAVPKRDPHADGWAFLAALGEAGRKTLLESMRGHVHTTYAAMILEAGLTNAQASEFGARLAQHWMDHLIVTSTEIGPDPEDDELSDEEMRAILGEATFRRWELAGRKNPGYEWAQGLALRIQRDPATPALDPAQMSELAEIVARHSPDFNSNGGVELAAVDWEGVAVDMQSRLTAAQWRHAQAWLLKQDIDREFSRQRTGSKP